MARQEITVDEKLCQFIRESGVDWHSLELLQFLARHPHTRFSRLVLVRTLDTWSLDIERALRHLINKGLVTMHSKNGIPLYLLTEDESLRSLVSSLANLDWYQWQLILEQTRG